MEKKHKSVTNSQILIPKLKLYLLFPYLGGIDGDTLHVDAKVSCNFSILIMYVLSALYEISVEKLRNDYELLSP